MIYLRKLPAAQQAPAPAGCVPAHPAASACLLQQGQQAPQCLMSWVASLLQVQEDRQSVSIMQALLSSMDRVCTADLYQAALRCWHCLRLLRAAPQTIRQRRGCIMHAPPLSRSQATSQQVIQALVCCPAHVLQTSLSSTQVATSMHNHPALLGLSSSGRCSPCAGLAVAAALAAALCRVRCPLLAPPPSPNSDCASSSFWEGTWSAVAAAAAATV